MAPEAMGEGDSTGVAKEKRGSSAPSERILEY